MWLVPLSGSFALAASIPPMRRTLRWLRPGSVRPLACAATAGVVALSSAALVLYHALARPDVTALGAALPVRALGGVALAGAVFAVLNATLEELVFRGVLFDALESQWGWQAAVGLTAVLFGLGHVGGYPPGWPGACLAGLYGAVLGLLRVWVGGLFLPILAHIAADATIYGILVYGGAV
jgi:membrane protease YdiL (CAAX protease family)